MAGAEVHGWMFTKVNWAWLCLKSMYILEPAVWDQWLRHCYRSGEVSYVGRQGMHAASQPSGYCMLGMWPLM